MNGGWVPVLVFLCGVLAGFLAWGAGYLKGRRTERWIWEERTMALAQAVDVAAGWNTARQISGDHVLLVFGCWLNDPESVAFVEKRRTEMLAQMNGHPHAVHKEADSG